MTPWADSMLQQMTTSAERCQARTAESRRLLADTRAFLSASRKVRVRTIKASLAQKPRKVQDTTWRSPRRGAYASPWRAPLSGAMDDVKVITAFHLRRMRENAGLSQPQLAARIDVDRRHVSRWERAEVSPSWTYICAMAELFGCNPGEFYVVPEDIVA